MRRVVGCLFGLAVLASSASAQFYALETPNVRLVYYSKVHEYIVPHIAKSYENAFRFHTRLWNYRPSEKVSILLHDFSDYGNAGAESAPHNYMRVAIAPLNYAFETTPAAERMRTAMNHELVHIVTMDKAAGSDRFFRTLFLGKVAPTPDHPLSIFYSYLTNPRRFAPRWYLEGIAVFVETWMAGGYGRALGSYDEMVFRTMVRDGRYFYDTVGLESEGRAIDFQVGALSYLYGTRFVSYLAYTYGPEKVLAWYNRNKGSKKSFGGQFKHVFGLSLDDGWRNWIKWEHAWQQANLDSIRQHPTTGFRQVSNRALGSVSRAFYNPRRRELYAAIRYPGQVAHIAAIKLDTGEVEKICDVKGPALYYVSSLAYDPETETLFYTTDNNGWRDLNAVDLRTRKSRLLMRDVRTGDLAFNRADRSIWGVKHLHGISTLVRIPYPYKEWQQVYSFPYGKDFFDLDVSPDGRTLTGALADVSGNQKLIKVDIARATNGGMSDDLPYEVLFDFENSTPATFVFSPDGRWLFGSSYYSGVSNIYRYDLQANDMSIISNCETGFFRPVPVSEDSLIVFRYTGDGFVPVMIANEPPEFVSAIHFLGNEIVRKHPVVQSWAVGSPATVPIDTLPGSDFTYSPIKGLTLDSIYPILEGYQNARGDDFATVGLRASFSDHLRLSALELSASYTPNSSLALDERFHAALAFYYWQWKVTATYNAANFYDLFGPTKTSRKGYSLGIHYNKNLIFDEPKTLDLRLRVVGYAGLDRLPDYQNVLAPFDKLLTAGASLDYSFVRKSLGAVDEEKGVKWRLVFDSNYVNSEFFPRLYGALDYGFALPLDHSSVWLRASLGKAWGDRDNPYANFFFGAFGNNYVDHLSEKRYREYYSFPGAEINQVSGKNYGKLLMEWNVPPLRFRRLGFPWLYANWARLALFGAALQTNVDAAQFRRTFFDVGAQLDFRLVLFSNLSSMLSFGYAVALEKGQGLGDAATEFMVSLKIL